MAKKKRKRPPHIPADLSQPSGRKRARREMVWGDHGFLRTRFQNLHQISDEMWRANQPSPSQIREHVQKRGIRTILNLRGASTKGYYLLEQEACAADGIALVDFQVFSRDAPSQAVILGAKELFQSIEYPALMHCKSGADRAGLMSGLYRMLREESPVEDALEQLSLKYLHVRQGKTGVLDAFFEAYQGFIAHTPKPFLEWVQEDYDAPALKEAFLKTWRASLRIDTLLRRE